MFSSVNAFLLNHYDQKKPLLLGFSGGPDSLALLHLLLQFKKNHPLELHLAHVDHGWREESGTEASSLEQEAKRLGLPFHFKKISPENLRGNLEAACRQERLSFFRELTAKYHFQAVLLGHHRDDQAETVLKSIFEGRSLPSLGGISSITTHEGVTLWRPLLASNKSQIEQLIMELELSPIRDSTNLDPRFLRGRFRTELIPLLSEKFGKEVSEALCNLGSEAQELKNYLNEKIAPYLAAIEEGALGLYLDLSPFMPLAPMELQLVIRSLAEKRGVTLSRESRATIVQLLESGAANRQINQWLHIDRQRLFLLKQEIPTLPTVMQPLSLGNSSFGCWDIQVERRRRGEPLPLPGWRELMQGSMQLVVPEADYLLGKIDQTLNKRLTNQKIPAFLRYKAPALWIGERIAYDCLTGKGGAMHESEQFFAISFSFRG